MKALRVILFILGIGCFTGAFFTYMYTSSYGKLEKAQTELEELKDQKMDAEVAEKIKNLEERKIPLFKRIVARSNQYIIYWIGSGILLIIVGIVLTIRKDKLQSTKRA